MDFREGAGAAHVARIRAVVLKYQISQPHKTIQTSLAVSKH